jgi:hypothetical protein
VRRIVARRWGRGVGGRGMRGVGGRGMRGVGGRGMRGRARGRGVRRRRVCKSMGVVGRANRVQTRALGGGMIHRGPYIWHTATAQAMRLCLTEHSWATTTVQMPSG